MKPKKKPEFPLKDHKALLEKLSQDPKFAGAELMSALQSVEDQIKADPEQAKRNQVSMKDASGREIIYHLTKKMLKRMGIKIK